MSASIIVSASAGMKTCSSDNVCVHSGLGTSYGAVANSNTKTGIRTNANGNKDIEVNESSGMTVAVSSLVCLCVSAFVRVGVSSDRNSDVNAGVIVSVSMIIREIVTVDLSVIVSFSLCPGLDLSLGTSVSAGVSMNVGLSGIASVSMSACRECDCLCACAFNCWLV